jgi:hypothetical protein
VKTIVVNIGQMTAKLPEDEASLSNEEVLLEDIQPSTPEVKVGSHQEKLSVEVVGYGNYIGEKYTHKGRLSVEDGWINQAKQDTCNAGLNVRNVLLWVGLGLWLLAKNMSNVTLERWLDGNRASLKDSLS